jgi:glycosyltransferase involved in cell wall biosynthesis
MAGADASRHIAIYLPSLRGGGAERVMVTLANGFAARGHRVDLVLVRAEGPYLPEVADNVRIVDLDRGRVLASLVPLARYLRRERPDAMLSALNHANVIAILARKLARVPTRLVVSERNSLTGRPVGLAGRAIRVLMRWLYPAADGVVAVSQAMAEELVTDLGLPPANVAAIPNPVDVASLVALAQARPGHAWLGDGQPPVLLAVGRLEPQKDYPTLLDAFARFRSQREARLVILGEGSQRAKLDDHIARLGLTGVVELAGFKDNPFGWMAACDLFVMSSRHEGFPNALVQAMACGARVVSTDCRTGPDEILEGGRWGRLVPVGDAGALAEAMADALDDKDICDAAARASEFGVETAVDSYLDRVLPSIGAVEHLSNACP